MQGALYFSGSSERKGIQMALPGLSIGLPMSSSRPSSMEKLVTQGLSRSASVASNRATRDNYHPPLTGYGVDPPRPPKEGHEWV